MGVMYRTYSPTDLQMGQGGHRLQPCLMRYWLRQGSHIIMWWQQALSISDLETQQILQIVLSQSSWFGVVYSTAWGRLVVGEEGCSAVIQRCFVVLGEVCSVVEGDGCSVVVHSTIGCSVVVHQTIGCCLFDGCRFYSTTPWQVVGSSCPRREDQMNYKRYWYCCFPNCYCRSVSPITQGGSYSVGRWGIGCIVD